MKIITSAAAAAALLASSAVAQTKQSKPFYLVASSSNSSIDGTHFDACHEANMLQGAAIEALCVGPKTIKKHKSYYQYRLNNTASTPNQGILSWLLPASPDSESEPMSLFVDPGSNVALPLFEPSYSSQYVGFDSNEEMYIISYINDTVTPPTADSSKHLYNWYTCETIFESYVYTTLAWLLGVEDKPQNPSCEKVMVKRVFVSN